MTRRDDELAGFLAAPDPAAYLRAHSHLPGPRGNLELLDTASAAADRADLERWAGLDAASAPGDLPDGFVACVGVVGLGRLVAAGDRSLLPRLRGTANDERWRVREAVAIGLQAWGDLDMPALLDEMDCWAGGTPLEGRAAMAALCEPRLLHGRAIVERVLRILGRLTMMVRDARIRATTVSASCGRRWATAGASRSPPTRGSAWSPWSRGWTT